MIPTPFAILISSYLRVFMVVPLCVLCVFGALRETLSSAAAADRVMPLVMPQTKVDLQSVDARVYQATEKQARYLLTTVHPWSEDPELRLLTASKSTENWIRPNTGAIEGFAFLYRFGPYDQKVVGVSRESLLTETILPMMRYVVATHVTGTRPTSDGKSWGNAWQSAHWAQMLGRAAWWLWDVLPTDLRDGTRRVVAHEADRIAAAQPPHQVRLDTKAEENAWNSQVLSVAVLLMPDDPRRPGWEKAFQKWALSSFLRPADAQCQTLVDGRTVAEQFTGANIYDDFTLENHAIVHPDYMTCFSLSLGCAMDYVMSGRKAPEALLYNVAPIYENLKWFLLPDGGFVYPNGQDWQLFRNCGWLRTHALMAVFAHDPDAWSLALRSLESLEKMQARTDTGAAYLPEEYFFASTQTDLLTSTARCWLTLQAADKIEDRPREPLGVRRLDSGKIILRRTPEAIHSFAWGARVMALYVPNRRDRIVSPHQASGIGHVCVASLGASPSAQSVLPTKVRTVNVTQGDDRFAAELVLDHGDDQIRAHLHFRSNADGSFSIQEKLVALSEVTTSEIATGLIGVLNNPHWIYERGRRVISCDGHEKSVPALSGHTIVANAVTRLCIDDVLEIRSPKPLSIRYLGATQAERSRVTDELSLNYLGGVRRWRAGETIGEFEATIRCRVDRPR